MSQIQQHRDASMKWRWKIAYWDGEYDATLYVHAKDVKQQGNDHAVNADGVVIELAGSGALQITREGE